MAQQIHRAIDQVPGLCMIGFGAVPGDDPIYAECPIMVTDHWAEPHAAEPTAYVPVYKDY